jgi:hypothetical protein
MDLGIARRTAIVCASSCGLGRAYVTINFLLPGTFETERLRSNIEANAGQNILIDDGVFPTRYRSRSGANKAGLRRPRRTPRGTRTCRKRGAKPLAPGVVRHAKIPCGSAQLCAVGSGIANAKILRAGRFGRNCSVVACWPQGVIHHSILPTAGNRRMIRHPRNRPHLIGRVLHEARPLRPARP